MSAQIHTSRHCDAGLLREIMMRLTARQRDEYERLKSIVTLEKCDPIDIPGLRDAAIGRDRAPVGSAGRALRTLRRLRPVIVSAVHGCELT